MLDFAHMSAEELIRPEGYECPCGKHHVTTLKYLKIGQGVLECLPEALTAVGAKRPMVVCDDNTYKVAGERVAQLLQAAGIPHSLYIVPCMEDRLRPAEWELGSICMHFDAQCDFILGVGSGVINDLCKVAGHATGRPTGIVGTAPSMDGYASNSSSMEVNKVKTTLYNACPVLILCDTQIIAQAPMRMLWAGLGDMAAKYISVCEWRISHLVTGEYYCESVAEMMRVSLRKIMANAEGIQRREPDAIQNIVEGLVMAGLAMAYAQVSRPASGLEHYFSHVWEMQALERGKPYDLHGIQVGVGTVLSMKLYEKIKEIRPTREHAQRAMERFDAVAWEKNIRRIFGATAPQILAIERQAGKNDPVKHEKRLSAILEHWDEIQKIIREELPDFSWLVETMGQTGMPLSPADLGISKQDVVDAFVGSRDIRDKYLSSSLLWDLGYLDEMADWLAQNC